MILQQWFYYNWVLTKCIVFKSLFMCWFRSTVCSRILRTLILIFSWFLFPKLFVVCYIFSSELSFAKNNIKQHNSYAHLLILCSLKLLLFTFELTGSFVTNLNSQNITLGAILNCILVQASNSWRIYKKMYSLQRG